MLRTRLLALVSLVIAVGCERSTTAPIRTDAPVVTKPATATPTQWRGVVEAFRGGPMLRLADGSEYQLAGTQSTLLLPLDGADVAVDGAFDQGGINVESFLVLTVGGTAVVDGVLVHSEGGYAMRLTADGSMRPIDTASDELAQHVGDRIWLQTDRDGFTIFGVISGAQ
jgi:hypothetical protein